MQHGSFHPVGPPQAQLKPPHLLSLIALGAAAVDAAPSSGAAAPAGAPPLLLLLPGADEAASFSPRSLASLPSFIRCTMYSLYSGSCHLALIESETAFLCSSLILDLRVHREGRR